MDNPIKLSVLIITYNHEKFLGKAIESVLDQETEFSYEIVIGEDCSQDNTCKVAARYQELYPDKINLLLTDCNLGPNRNFARTLRACRGEYVALLEGDDYWTYSRKLQEQVEFLDSHPDCAMCFHNVEEFCEYGSWPPRVRYEHGRKALITTEDILKGGQNIQTSTIVARNRLITEFPDWFYQLPYGDWSFHVLIMQFGNAAYLDRVMSAYRCHNGGAWTGSTPDVFWKAHLRMYRFMDEYFGGRYKSLFRNSVSLRYYWLAYDCEAKGDLRTARAYALRRVLLKPVQGDGEQPLKHLLRLYVPQPLYGLCRSIKRRIVGVLKPRKAAPKANLGSLIYSEQPDYSPENTGIIGR